MKTLIYIIIILGAIKSISYSQPMTFITNLDSAIEQSIKYQKPLLIYRYDGESIHRAKAKNYKSSGVILASVFEDLKILSELKKEFILHGFDIRNLNKKHELFYDQFRYYFDPNIIILNPDLSIKSFVKLSNYGGEQNIIDLIDETIDDQKDKINKIQHLNNRYQTGTISNNELHELIVLENEFSLRTKEKIEKYCKNEGPLTYEIDDISKAQGFTSFDFFTEYIMKAPHPEAEFLRLGYLNNLIEVAKYKTLDKKEFENCMKMKLKIGEKSILENINVEEDFPKNALRLNLEIENLLEYFEFYSKIIDTINIKKYGKLIANELISGYDLRKKKFVDEQDSLVKWMFKGRSFEIGDSTVQVKLNEVTKKHENDFNKKTIHHLNSICWQFAININDQKATKEAINWAEFGLTIKESAHLLDTYAHLLFKLGEKTKAIEYQEQALLKAELENIRKKSLENMKSFLKELKAN